MPKGRPGGNPDFGAKIKPPLKFDEPVSAKPIAIKLVQSQYDVLMEMPSHERLALIRRAIERELVERGLVVSSNGGSEA